MRFQFCPPIYCYVFADTKKSSQLLKRLIVQDYSFEGFLIALPIIGVLFILFFLCKTKQNKTKKAENSVEFFIGR